MNLAHLISETMDNKGYYDIRGGVLIKKKKKKKIEDLYEPPQKIEDFYEKKDFYEEHKNIIDSL